MAILDDIADATRFLSRLPLPAGGDPAPLAETLRYGPIAGCVIAIGPALLLVAASALGLSALLAASLATMGLLLVTGALHEDGLADVVDGFGGGRTVERKLDIMRDSRVGTYGVLTLGCALLVRVGCLQMLLDRRGALMAASVLVLAESLSRSLMLIPLQCLTPPRPDGLAHRVGPLAPPTLPVSLVIAVLIGAVLSNLTGNQPLAALNALLYGFAVSLVVTHLARRQIGGVTGDVVGATQVVAALTISLTLCCALGRR